MAEPKEQTIFHLVPCSSKALEALEYDKNKKFVSKSSIGVLGLEIGYHLTRVAEPDVIATVGWNGNLIIENESSRHIAFKVHRETHVVMLSMGQGKVGNVSVAVDILNARPESVEDKYVLGWGINYVVDIDLHKLSLVWYPTKDIAEKVSQQYYDAVSA